MSILDAAMGKMSRTEVQAEMHKGELETNDSELSVLELWGRIQEVKRALTHTFEIPCGVGGYKHFCMCIICIYVCKYVCMCMYV